MGLDIMVGDEYSDRVGSYGWFHAFRQEVADKLEKGVWGSRYPHLQLHSDCDGTYTPKEAERLLEELKEIKKRLKEVNYPTIEALKNGKVIKRRESYGHRTFMSSGGVSLGVCPEGIFFELYQIDGQKKLEFPTDGTHERPFGNQLYIGYFTSIKKVGRRYIGTYSDGRTRTLEYELERTLDWFSNRRADKYVVGQIRDIKVFGRTIKVLQKACRTSIKTKKPITYY